MKVIPIISAAGGVGKTTLSLMLSYVLTPHNYNVLLIDMDPTAGLTLRMFGDLAYYRLLNERKTLIDMIKDSENKNSVNIRDYIIYGKQVRGYDSDVQLHSEFYNVAVLPPGEGFDEFFAKHLYRDVGRIVWKVLYKSGIDMFDVVIVDTAPFFDERYTLIALHNMDRAIIVLRPTLTDINRTNAMINKVSRSFQELDERIPSFILVFNFEYNKYVIEAKTLEKVLEIKRLDEDVSGRIISVGITDKAKNIDEILERNLKELINRKDVSIDYLRYVMPYDVKFSDEVFPRINYKISSSSRKIKETDYTILVLTLKHLIEKFDLKLDTAFDVDKY
ncbi:MAG: AAA family ATPase [Vulcanisaeta sp.]